MGDRWVGFDQRLQYSNYVHEYRVSSRVHSRE